MGVGVRFPGTRTGRRNLEHAASSCSPRGNQDGVRKSLSRNVSLNMLRLEGRQPLSAVSGHIGGDGPSLQELAGLVDLVAVHVAVGPEVEEPAVVVGRLVVIAELLENLPEVEVATHEGDRIIDVGP